MVVGSSNLSVTAAKKIPIQTAARLNRYLNRYFVNCPGGGIWVDTLDLGSSAQAVRVQVSPGVQIFMGV